MARARTKVWIGTGLVAISFMSTACGYPVRREKLENGFVLFAADDPSDLSLCREIEVHTCAGGVASLITAVGMNARFITVARSPPDQAQTEYYYIDLKSVHPEFDDIHGPFSKAAFDMQSRALALPPPNMRVDKTYTLKRPFKWSNYAP